MSNGGNSSGGCLRTLVVIGLLIWGGRWMWNNQRDLVLDWKSRLQSWLAPFGGGARGERTALEPERAHFPLPNPLDTRKNESDPAWKRAENWTRAKAADIDSLTESEMALIEAWDDNKPVYARMLHEMRQGVQRYTSAPAYSYDQGLLRALQADMEVVGRCIDKGDPLRLADRLPELQAEQRAFRNSVRWRAGVPHPTAQHVHSAAKPDEWEPDDGYVFTSATSGDLSVTYRGHAYRCQSCHGTGSIVRTLTCPNCQGRGRVPNPAIQAGNAMITGLEIFNSLSKRPKKMHVHPVNDPGIVCGTCNGHRQIRQTEPCPDCEGGTVWR